MSKTIFFDLDGTLYSYNFGHLTGLRGAFEYWKKLTGDDYNSFLEKYSNSRKKIKRFLTGTAGSHSRVLYFQGMVEENFLTSQPYHIAELTQRYWDTFIDSIRPFEGVEKTLQILKDDGYRLAIITNMSAEVQFRKLHKLNLDNYFEAMISSEEVGQEKPHPHIFFHAIDRLKVNPKQCIMIGDDLKNDIEVANFVGMTPILITIEVDNPTYDGYKLKKYIELLNIVQQINAEPLDGVIKYSLNHRKTQITLPKDQINQLIELRDKLHELHLIGVYPPDHYLTPNVGFGNASLRYTSDGQFIVSGSHTGDIEKTKPNDYSLVIDFNVNSNSLMSKGETKPSSESLTHAAIYEIAPEVNCVIHVHNKELWENHEKFNMLTTPKDVLYGTPDMARAIQDVYKKNSQLEAPICMLGHIEGLLTWGKTKEDALQLYLKVLKQN
jgi:putative hydrolase of the HAD superfamily